MPYLNQWNYSKAIQTCINCSFALGLILEKKGFINLVFGLVRAKQYKT